MAIERTPAPPTATTPPPRIGDLAASIHSATGYTGDELTVATFFAAAIFADVFGRRDIGDYYTRRAVEISQRSA